MRKIGILTGGGDCPGLNAVIRSVVELCTAEQIDIFGFFDGWRGVIQSDGKWLTLDDVNGIQTIGGTILGSSRLNILRMTGSEDLVRATMEELGLECIVAIGGDDTLGVANHLQKQGMDMIGVPKTIDNDLSHTDYTFGFDSATNVAMQALDNLKYTALSHHRIFVVEMMGRENGWITVQAGIAGNAHVIIIPEFPMQLEEICAIVAGRFRRGQKYSLIAVAEGAEIVGLETDENDIERDAFGNIRMVKRCISDKLARAITNNTGLETRNIVLGHIQRGGCPSCFDRVLAARMGYCAAEQAIDRNYGVMVSLQGNHVETVALDAALNKRKEVGEDLYKVARLYFR